MAADHTCYAQLASQRRDSAEYGEGYTEAQRAYSPHSPALRRAV